MTRKGRDAANGGPPLPAAMDRRTGPWSEASQLLRGHSSHEKPQPDGAGAKFYTSTSVRENRGDTHGRVIQADRSACVNAQNCRPAMRSRHAAAPRSTSSIKSASMPDTLVTPSMASNISSGALANRSMMIAATATMNNHEPRPSPRLR
jgi:hypothetical protein